MSEPVALVLRIDTALLGHLQGTLHVHENAPLLLVYLDIAFGIAIWKMSSRCCLVLFYSERTGC